jgi:uncharacterized membrane protein YqjE
MEPLREAQNQANDQDKSLFALVEDLLSGFQNLLRSEVRLVRAEFEESAKTAKRHIFMAITFGILAVLGLLPFLAFSVIGLGKILDDNYWLSSLLVSLVCMITGTVLAIRFGRKVKEEDLALSRTRQSLKGEAQFMREKVREISDVVQRRA